MFAYSSEYVKHIYLKMQYNYGLYKRSNVQDLKKLNNNELIIQNMHTYFCYKNIKRINNNVLKFGL